MGNSLHRYYGRTFKFFVKPFNPLCEAPREAGRASFDGRAHLNPPSSWDQTESAECGITAGSNPENEFLPNTERAGGKESFSQGPASPGFPTFATEGTFPIYGPSQQGHISVQASGKPRHWDTMSQCSRNHWGLQTNKSTSFWLGFFFFNSPSVRVFFLNLCSTQAPSHFNFASL